MCRVHVEPDAVLAAERADRLEVVVQPGAGGARRGHERHRAPAGGAAALERAAEGARDDSLLRVYLEVDHRALA